ncbi:MAG: hypothetical protein IK020_02505 [Clostridiales bacterium]|nr:hypothetical protein [Clostridiales bacterium]
MKCHLILGIDENATEQEIDQAYQEKYDKLCENRESRLESAKEYKIKELWKARSDSLKWRTLTTREKRSERLKEAGGSLINPALLISSPIHCCRDCCGFFASDECCCLFNDGEQEAIEGCGRQVDDCGCLIVIVLAIIGLAPMIPIWIVGWKTKRIQKLRKQLEEVQAEKQRALKEEQRAKAKLEPEEDKFCIVGSFGVFFKAIGCNDSSDICKRQWGMVEKSEADWNQAYGKVQQLSNKIQQLSEELQRLQR